MKSAIAIFSRVLCAAAIVSTIGISAATNSSASSPRAGAPAGAVQVAGSPGVGV